MRVRVGVFGTVNAVIGVAFFAVFSVLSALLIVRLATGAGDGWSAVACVVSLTAAVVMALLAASGLSTWRCVEVRTDATRTVLSVPGFTARRGFYRDSVAVGDISDVRLAYLSQPRNGRWQLLVTRRGGPPLRSDSITCSRSRNANVRGTRAWRAVEQLREQVDPPAR